MVPHAHMPRSAQEEVDNLYIQRIMADDQFRRTSDCYSVGTYFYFGGDFLILCQKCSLKALVTSYWHCLCYLRAMLLLKIEALQVGRMGVVKYKDQEVWLHLFASILPGPSALWSSRAAWWASHECIFRHHFTCFSFAAECTYWLPCSALEWLHSLVLTHLLFVVLP